MLAGSDINDQTTIKTDLGKDLLKEKYTLGICKELKDKLQNIPQFVQKIEELKQKGYEIKEVSVPHILNSLACYYIISPAEATSNLARFDGVKYTSRSNDAKTLEEIYVKSRSEGFGDEVKRRIMLGNFVLSSGYFDAYYNKAKKLQQLLRQEFETAFLDCDIILSPTTPDIAFKLGEKSKDPVSMYLEDLFTVPASISGVPALSIPYATGREGMPLGLQLIGKEKSEAVLYDFAKKIMQEEK